MMVIFASFVPLVTLFSSFFLFFCFLEHPLPFPVHVTMID
jgi:hypothetical protein